MMSAVLEWQFHDIAVLPRHVAFLDHMPGLLLSKFCGQVCLLLYVFLETKPVAVVYQLISTSLILGILKKQKFP